MAFHRSAKENDNSFGETPNDDPLARDLVVQASIYF